jgi:hypothetical protein
MTKGEEHCLYHTTYQAHSHSSVYLIQYLGSMSDVCLKLIQACHPCNEDKHPHLCGVGVVNLNKGLSSRC